jgi:Domain of unknown function (DUF5666)
MLLLVSCGGGDRRVADGSIGGTGIIASGPISAFGSVFVNGIEFRTSPATQINVNGSANRAQSDLGLGFVVTVNGSFDANGIAASASSIDYGSNLRGAVEGIDARGGTMRVLGQTVRVTTGTVLSNLSSLGGLNANDMVELSGLVDAEGRIVATYMERQAPFAPGVSTLALRGTVANLTAGGFSIGNIAVDYSMLLPNNLSGGSLSNSGVVEVDSNRLPQNGVLIATRVRIIDQSLGATEGSQISVQGLISATSSAASFTMVGVAVTTDAQTIFENGSAGNLANNAKVQVRGRWSHGAIVASTVSFI